MIVFSSNITDALDRPKSSVALSSSSELHAPWSPVSQVSSAATSESASSRDIKGRESMRQTAFKNVNFKGKQTVLEEHQKKAVSETKKNYEVDFVGNG